MWIFLIPAGNFQEHGISFSGFIHLECFLILFKNPPGNSQGQGILGLTKFLSTKIFLCWIFSLAVTLKQNFSQFKLRTFLKQILKSDLYMGTLVTKIFYLQELRNPSRVTARIASEKVVCLSHLLHIICYTVCLYMCRSRWALMEITSSN